MGKRCKPERLQNLQNSKDVALVATVPQVLEGRTVASSQYARLAVPRHWSHPRIPHLWEHSTHIPTPELKAELLSKDVSGIAN